MTAQVLGRYEIVETLGRGAMSVVYLAQDPALGRLVALKALTGGSSATDDPATQNCLREARTAGSLDHPNIVTVHDVATTGEQPFIAMEFVQGTDLKELLRPRCPLPHDFTVKLITQVAAALDHAHDKGVVHRDVKPGNILITNDEDAKLADFGIAAIAGDVVGDRLGTAHYVAPEQLLGKAVDGRADVFSLGVVAYEMLTGRRPFAATGLEEVVRRLAHEPFTPLGEHGVQLPAAVEGVFSRALAKDPADRFSSAAELAEALQAALQSADEAATRDLSDLLPEPPAAPATPPARRATSLRWAAAAALALAAVATSGWAIAQRNQEEGPERLLTAPPHRLRAPHAELTDETNRLAAAGDVLSAARSAELASRLAPHRDDVEQLRRSLAEQADVYRAERHRESEIGALLAAAQKAREAGRYDDALAALRRAARLDPEQPAVRKLERLVRNAQARRPAPTEGPQPSPHPALPAPATRPAVAAPAPKPPPDWSDLRIDLFSHLPRGVLTVYAGGEQVLQQTFRFGKRAGVFRRQAGAGRLEAKRRLSAGDTELRVYLSLPGEQAASRSFQARLDGGETRVLRILVDEQGGLEARLD